MPKTQKNTESEPESKQNDKHSKDEINLFRIDHGK
jgi:hypothetical protein